MMIEQSICIGPKTQEIFVEHVTKTSNCEVKFPKFTRLMTNRTFITKKITLLKYAIKKGYTKNPTVSVHLILIESIWYEECVWNANCLFTFVLNHILRTLLFKRSYCMNVFKQSVQSSSIIYFLLKYPCHELHHSIQEHNKICDASRCSFTH